MKSARKDIKLYIFFALIAYYLCKLWFGDGNLLAFAEEGLPFYDPTHTLNLYRTIWTDIGLGFAVPFFAPKMPFLKFLSFLQSMGFAGYVSQQFVFGLLIFTALVSMFKLVRTLFPAKEKSIAVVASLFYLFNLYVLSQIWLRFLLPSIFLWVYVPLFCFLWLKYLSRPGAMTIIALGVSGVIYSYTYAIPSSVFVLWFFAGAISLNMFFVAKDKWRIVYLSFVGIVIWLLFNSWWVLPFILPQANSYSAILDSNQSISSLVEVSEFFPTEQIMLLKQKYMFSEEANPWFMFYNIPKSIYASLLVFGVSVWGFISARRTKYFIAPALMLVVGWFVAKGAHPPLGLEVYMYLFEKVPVLQILRNPYEKFGLAFVLPYAIFFAIGVSRMQKIHPLIGKVLVLCTLVVSIWYLPWPMRTSRFMLGYQVKVPDYYAQASDYISANSKGRILQLPFLYGSQVEYNWGYKGEEPSEYLFENPSISKTFFLPEYDEMYLLLGKYINSPNFLKLLSLFNIDTLVLHKDIVVGTYHQQDYEATQRTVQFWKNVPKAQSFEELDVYLFKGNQIWDNPIRNKIVMYKNSTEAFDAIIENKLDLKREVFMTEDSFPDVPFEFEFSDAQVRGDKLSASEYVYHVTNSTGPFLFVLPVAYNPSWRMTINGRKVEKHFKVNGYANAWIVEQSGSFKMLIKFNTL